MVKMKFYIASDLFSEERKNYINRFAKSLRTLGLEVYVPHEHAIKNADTMPNCVWAKKVFEEDIKAIDECDCLIYICEGMTGDIGSAWECGYAYAKGKVIRVDEYKDPATISLMVAQCSNTEIYGYQS